MSQSISISSSIDELKAKGYFEFKGRKKEQTLIHETKRKKSTKKEKRGSSHFKILPVKFNNHTPYKVWFSKIYYSSKNLN